MGLEGREQRALAAVIENDNKPNRKSRKIEIKKKQAASDFRLGIFDHGLLLWELKNTEDLRRIFSIQNSIKIL